MISRLFRAVAGSATCAGTRPATKEDPGRTPDPTPCQFSGQPFPQDFSVPIIQ